MRNDCKYKIWKHFLPILVDSGDEISAAEMVFQDCFVSEEFGINSEVLCGRNVLFAVVYKEALCGEALIVFECDSLDVLVGFQGFHFAEASPSRVE